MASTRDPWLDNAKMGLIVLVVVGHLWALLPSDSISGHLYDFVYLWHMPAFVFLSGYLSRSWSYSPARIWQLVTLLLVPYVVFEGALGWFRLHAGGEELPDLWTDPHFPMWYLIALFAWRLLTPVFRPMWGGVAVAVGICVLGGYLEGDWARWLDLPRILGFLPFFVLGLKTTPEALEWLRGRFPAIVGLLTFTVIGALAVHLDDWASAGHLYHRPYEFLDESASSAILTRLLVLAVGVAGTLAWLALVPRIDGWFARMGVATMIVYLFHGFAVKAMVYAGFPEWAEAYPTLGLLVATTFGLAVALGLAVPPVRRVLQHVVDPFGSAQQKVHAAVDLTVVAQDAEERELVTADR